jgi:hypothetical protein
MRNCPKDVAPSDFRALLREVGDGLVLEGSQCIGTARYFRFRVEKPRDVLRRGDVVEFPVARKPMRRY